MAQLAKEVANLGPQVVYVAEQALSPDRRAMGWSAPDMDNVRVEYISDAAAVGTLLSRAGSDSIHICQGIRSNGLVAVAQSIIRAAGLRHWVVMETVDDTGWVGAIKRLEYRRLVFKWRADIRLVLAIGKSTPQWLRDRGSKQKICSFAYFLRNDHIGASAVGSGHRKFRFIFVGQFIERKRLDLLVEALRELLDFEFELAVVGSGPLEDTLRQLAESCLPGRVSWIGGLHLSEVPAAMLVADCLVLPSRHDGWGAVVSESLMVGTPVVCSDKCGASGVVKASGRGGVFPSGRKEDLRRLLRDALVRGVVSQDERASLARWARCLGAQAGAAYLMDILNFDLGKAGCPSPPWDSHGPGH